LSYKQRLEGNRSGGLFIGLGFDLETGGIRCEDTGHVATDYPENEFVLPILHGYIEFPVSYREPNTSWLCAKGFPGN